MRENSCIICAVNSRPLSQVVLQYQEILAGVHGQLLMLSCISRAARNGILSNILHNQVSTVMEKVTEKNFFSRSWKSQGILFTVSENEQFLKGQGKSVLVREFSSPRVHL